MVSLFRQLHHVTQKCANIDNTDQIFLDFSNKHLFYDDDDDEYLPIPVYSGIKPSTVPEFILYSPFLFKVNSKFLRRS